MDQGIIASVNRHARACLLTQDIKTMPKRSELRDIVKFQRTGTAGLKYGYGAHLLDAIKIFNYCLANLTQKRISNCCVRAGILNRNQIKDIILACGEIEPKEFDSSPGILAEDMHKHNNTTYISSAFAELDEGESGSHAQLTVQERQEDGMELF